MKVKNTREHDISLSTPRATVTVPAATKHPDDPNKMVHGVAEVDDKHLLALKDNAAVNHYFDEGWLVKSEKKEAKENPATK